MTVGEARAALAEAEREVRRLEAEYYVTAYQALEAAPGNYQEMAAARDRAEEAAVQARLREWGARVRFLTLEHEVRP